MTVTKLFSLVVTFSLTLCTEAAFAAMVDAIPPKIQDIIVDQVCAFRQTERRRPDICKKIKRQAPGKEYTKDYKTVRKKKKVTPLVHWRSKKGLVREGLRMSRTDEGRG